MTFCKNSMTFCGISMIFCKKSREKFCAGVLSPQGGSRRGAGVGASVGASVGQSLCNHLILSFSVGSVGQ
jgi:hypothetical protein